MAKPPADSSLLFGALAESGKIKQRKNGSYRMVLEGVDEITWFTDRPNRVEGTWKPQKLLRRWDKYFATSEPNAQAAVEVEEQRELITFEMFKPKIKSGAMIFNIKPISNSGNDKLTGLKGIEMRDVSLFIDDAEPNSAPQSSDQQLGEVGTSIVTNESLQSLMRIYYKSQLSPYKFWQNSDLSNADFSGTNFPYSPQFDNANLSDTNFANASLKGADFTGADLSSTNFSGANLLKAKFGNNNMDDANFSGARFDGADFGTDLSILGANFSDASFLDTTFEGKIIDDKTLFDSSDPLTYTRAVASYKVNSNTNFTNAICHTGGPKEFDAILDSLDPSNSTTNISLSAFMCMTGLQLPSGSSESV